MNSGLQIEETGVVQTGKRGVSVLEDTTKVRSLYSVVGKTNVDTIEVNTPTGNKIFVIPAIHRTCYWGILRYMYENHSRKVYPEELCHGVDEIMTDADNERWCRFMKKSQVMTTKCGVSVSKSARSWQDRLITNARNLCRIGKKDNAYGRRLVEVGQVMRLETEQSGDSYFILHLTLTPENTAPHKKGRKKKNLVGKE